MASDHISSPQQSIMPTTQLTIEITSFSYKSPLPTQLFSWEDGRHGGGFVFDCRSLPNPGREESFRNKTGLDHVVQEYLEASPQVPKFLEHVVGLVTDATQSFLDRKFTFITVGFGCTGGQHRSVYCCEALRQALQSRFGDKVRVLVYHPALKDKGLLTCGP